MRKIGKSQEAQHNNGYKGDPALEFIKNVCSVMLFDKNVLHDIQKPLNTGTCWQQGHGLVWNFLMSMLQ
nr:DNA polymerase epsilon catalytic subunit A-like [Tanacetum cinerariifolium]